MMYCEPNRTDFKVPLFFTHYNIKSFPESQFVLRITKEMLVGYEPAGLTVHPPPPPE